MVFSFAGTAGQWVELKSTSEKDTLLRLAAPDREGAYSVVAENDDSDGLNPAIRRKLPVTGTYFVQVDSLSERAGRVRTDAEADRGAQAAAATDGAAGRWHRGGQAGRWRRRGDVCAARGGRPQLSAGTDRDL
jgi:hypothetical protein